MVRIVKRQAPLATCNHPQMRRAVGTAVILEGNVVNEGKWCEVKSLVHHDLGEGEVEGKEVRVIRELLREQGVQSHAGAESYQPCSECSTQRWEIRVC